ncbi:TPA: hypothetical protein RQK38_000520 [Vibrio vulnificus]|nr:hypothetical protein [Vibrio vulnificus]
MRRSYILESDLPKPNQYTNIYELSRYELHQLMLTGHAHWNHTEEVQKGRIPILLTTADKALVTGKRSAGRPDEVSIRHIIATGIKINSCTMLSNLWLNGYNASLQNVCRALSISDQGAKALTEFITTNWNDRQGIPQYLNFDNLIEYLFTKGVIKKQKKASFSREFLKLTGDNVYRLTWTALSRQETVGVMFYFTVLTRLLEYLEENDLNEHEKKYLTICAQIAWYGIHNDAHQRKAVEFALKRPESKYEHHDEQ